ncbi:F-box/FBD/LRR-repeat protein At4g00160-like [Vicia villosa]|uniref:F-box/FBD/LRR-repeat protein At4g00160-like n=1 Tax=Vicia villosa TaxID=3911 RepID=UPI00273B7E12|nr:F-box/FBD/LRR-repeat protein At4g00160-like [Vicia villosa]
MHRHVISEADKICGLPEKVLCREEISKPDKISDLPEEVLGRILSFLTTKKAVSTGILSKRWINLWKLCDSIDFIGIEADSFEDSVNSVLDSRDAVGSRFIKDFSLDCTPTCLHVHNLFKWINFLVQCKIQNLLIHIDLDEIGYHLRPKLPSSIFASKTLVRLELWWFCLEGFAFSSVGFPSLKTLHLRGIIFPEPQGAREFLLLLSASPILEDLEVCYVLLGCMEEEESVIFQEFRSLRLPKLTTATISYSPWSCIPLEALTSSKSLCLGYLLSHQAYKVNQPQGPIFHNLTSLELHNSWELVGKVLHQCPKLQNLKLYEDCHGIREGMKREFLEDYPETWVDPECVPQCLLSQLRSCTIESILFLMLPTYILKNARILQSMKIEIPCKIKQRRMSLCPKASPTCELIVYG